MFPGWGGTNLGLSRINGKEIGHVPHAAGPTGRKCQDGSLAGHATDRQAASKVRAEAFPSKRRAVAAPATLDRPRSRPSPQLPNPGQLLGLRSSPRRPAGPRVPPQRPSGRPAVKAIGNCWTRHGGPGHRCGIMVRQTTCRVNSWLAAPLARSIFASHDRRPRHCRAIPASRRIGGAHEHPSSRIQDGHRAARGKHR